MTQRNRPECDAEVALRSLLHNAAAREATVALAAPESPSPDYQTGFGAGYEAGELAALALAVSLVTGESATGLIDAARAQAAVELAFPFELHIDDADAADEVADSDKGTEAA